MDALAQAMYPPEERRGKARIGLLGRPKRRASGPSRLEADENEF